MNPDSWDAVDLDAPMETDDGIGGGNWNLSAGLSSSYSSSSSSWLNSPCPSFEFFMATVVIGTVCVIGLVGNTLSFLVLGNDRQNPVATFLLQCLAIADNALLLVSIFVLSAVLGPFQIPSTIPALRQVVPYMKKYVHPFGPITQSCAIWITVLLAINRYIAVCKPFASKRLLTLRKAQIQVAAVVVLSVAFNVPRFFQYDVIYRLENNITVPRKQLTELGKNVSFDIGYFHVFYNIVILVLPLVALVVFNTKIIWDMQRSKHNMRRNSLYYAGLQERNITIVMLIIILKLILFHSPDRIVSAVKIIEVHRNPYITCPHPVIYASHFSNLMVILSSSTDFFIYCIFRERFRRIFCFRFCCRSRVSGWDLRNSLERMSSNYSTESAVNNRPNTTIPIAFLLKNLGKRSKRSSSFSTHLLSHTNSIVSRQGSIPSQNGDAKDYSTLQEPPTTPPPRPPPSNIMTIL